MRLIRWLLVCVMALVSIGGTAMNARAAYPPDPEDCIQTGVRRDGKFVPKDTFYRGQEIIIRGTKKCAKRGAVVRAFFDTTGHVLGKTRANEDGSYSIKGKIPDNARLGTHTIMVKTGDRRYEKPITVKKKQRAQPASQPSVARRAVGLTYPWGLILVALAAVFVLFPRRRRSVGDARPRKPARDPVGEVPHIDASAFVGARSRGSDESS